MLDFPNNPEFIFTFLINGLETFVLDQSPDGWGKTVIQLATSKTYIAVRRTLSGNYTFIGNAAMICRREWYTNGAMADIIMTIKHRQNDLTYATIYTGKLNFADPETGDVQKGFLVPSVTADFTQNIDAYDSVNYEIDISDGVNVELPALQLNETGTILIQPNTDHRSNAFFILSIVNNTQNSINPSLYDYDGQFLQLNSPTWDDIPYYFYWARTNCNVTFNVNIAGIAFYNGGSGSAVYSIQVWKSDNTLVKTLYSSSGTTQSFNISQNFTLPVLTDDKLFLYFATTDGDSNWGFRINAGEIDLSYETQSPPTMTKAINGEQLFSRLLTAMNPNNNGVPDAPVPYQSFLLSMGVLKPVYFTCSDSIRSGNGSFYAPGSTIGQGVYQVLQGEINYDGKNITAPNTFFFDGTLSFTQVGGTYAYVQKIQSIFVGNVYNNGDSLEQGGTFLVEVGTTGGGGIIYNGKFIAVGQFFDYVLGQDTFEQADIGGDNFVKQTAEAPKIVTNLADLFQCVKSLMWGDACLGTGDNGVFIETLATAFQSGAPVNADFGIASADWKRVQASDLMYSNFKGGYSDQQYTTANGYQEVNSTQEYSTGVMLTTSSAPAGTYPNELNVVNPYRADPLGYEEMRISQNDTAASRSNNEVCLLWLNLTPTSTAGYMFYRPILKADVTDLYGVVDGYYNFMLSPKSCLMRGINYLASIFYNLTTYPLVLASAVKNSAMVYIVDGVRIAEADSVLIPTSATPYFIPMYLTDTVGIDSTLLPKIDMNKFAAVKITVNNIVCYGFPVDIKANAARGDNEAIKLLLAPPPKNDLGLFIR